MAVELVVGAVAGASALQLVATALLVVVVASIALRVAQNHLPSKRPPVFEGIPYVGGLLKFAGVSGPIGGLAPHPPRRAPQPGGSLRHA
jgi:hypothetical protein